VDHVGLLSEQRYRQNRAEYFQAPILSRLRSDDVTGRVIIGYVVRLFVCTLRLAAVKQPLSGYREHFSEPMTSRMSTAPELIK
jgi:hypothetical protein